MELHVNPLEFVKYIVSRLQGTSYESAINALLFLLFAVAVVRLGLALLGAKGRRAIINAAKTGVHNLKTRRGYAPEAESFRKRVAPYAELVGSGFFAFVGLYSGVVVALTAFVASQLHTGAPWWAYVVAIVWVLGSFLYMRLNLESATWAYHELKSRRNG